MSDFSHLGGRIRCPEKAMTLGSGWLLVWIPARVAGRVIAFFGVETAYST